MEIVDVLHRLCRALDARDKAAIRDCLHHNTGRETTDSFAHQFCEDAIRVLNSLEMTLHLVSNIEIEIEGDRASVLSCFTSHSKTRSGGEILLPDCGPNEAVILAGRYDDGFIRHMNRWGLISRKTTIIATYRTRCPV
jgi:hypothetical protein